MKTKALSFLSFFPARIYLRDLKRSSPISPRDYLYGIRGILCLQSFLFVFLQLFSPSAVVDSQNTSGPLYQVVLRKTLAVVLWNRSFIFSFIILLSARTICLPFLDETSSAVCASAIFRRGIRLFFPTFVAFSLCAAAFSTDSTQYIDDFLTTTGNNSTSTPIRFRNFLVYFNSLYDVFWLNKWYGSQAANLAFPSGTLCIVSILFQQSYTVYMTMVIIPYTRKSWRIKALLVFIVTAWWVQSWGWYSITGLVLADAVCNMDFKFKSQSGLRISKWKLPVWPIYGLLAVSGLLLQYMFIAWRPEMRSQALKGHTGLYTGGTLNEQMNTEQPQARDDDYLVILGLMLAVETYDGLQRALSWKPLVALGKRSFSVFLVQSLLLYTVGIRLHIHMRASGASHEVAVVICFVVSTLAVALASEVFYVVVELSSVKIAHKAWIWVAE